MLACLRVQQLAIIDHIELELGPGLNVITGETGAGKSILVRAIQLVLGGRASPDLIRHGCDRAEVEALFDLDAANRSRLAEAGFDMPEQLIVRRVILNSGRSRAYINGRLATLVELQRLASMLMDLSSQHEHHTLAEPGTHLRFLDLWSDLAPRAEELASAVKLALAAARDVQALHDRLAERADREDLLRFQANELDKLDPKPDEDVELLEEAERLRAGEELARTSQAVEHQLDGGERAALTQVDRAMSALQNMARIEPVFETWVEQLQSARAELEDVAEQAGRYARKLDHDPSHLEAVEDRLAALKRAMRRYGGTLEAVIAKRQQVVDELSEFDQAELRVDALQLHARAAARAALDLATELSTQRRKAAQGLGQAITHELAGLGMGHAQVSVQVQAHPAESGLQVDGKTLTRDGLDHVEFLIAPNPGEPARPLHKVASGGELSRSLLAIKQVLAGLASIPTYVFDEIDTGVGGGVSEVIGKKLAGVASHHQVLCITHSPQIAAYAAQHFHVRKQVEDDRTHSRVQLLDDDARIEELSRMLGGIEITDVTRAAAEQLRQGARP